MPKKFRYANTHTIDLTTIPSKIYRLRLAFEHHYAIVAMDSSHHASPMQAFLALSIKERLVLLCKVDGADEHMIRRVLPYAKQSDARLIGKTMIAATKTLKRALQEVSR